MNFRFLFPALAFAVAGGVAAATVGPLPAPTCPDTEVSTNCPFTSACGRTGLFSLTLDLAATPSNNVEIAFGTDADADGVLAQEETGLALGWDCGRWFLREGWVGAARFAEPATASGVKALRWQLWLADGMTPRRLSVKENGEQLELGAADTPPPWLFSPDWNLVRVTARGVDVPGAEVSWRVGNEAFILRLR